jgi:hypothetical protein
MACLNRYRDSEMVIVEEDAQQIEYRLDDAELRLRNLSTNTKSSVKELRKIFGTVEKKSKSTTLKNTSTPGGHLQVIRHHLNLI